ncbi:MAG TPA: selenium metabolism-associated LysR family transcriptional regulator [Syntrophomonadaceae bacterium]|nr:selenium metabolism-associated LysR family transcriptional regulator [Syntrophomonadaceae bacterium]
MNLNLFKTFVKVVETQNLSKTAQEFGLSQPAITKQIQSLEDYYGVLLLERSGRSLKTTEAGNTLYQYSKDIIKLLDKTEKMMEEVSASRRGRLNLAASTIPGQYILPQVIKKFKDKFPNVSIGLNIGDTEDVFYQVAEREIDVGVVGGWIKNRKIEGFTWLEDELVLVVPENHKCAQLTSIKISELINEKWVIRSKGSGTRQAVEEILDTNGIKIEDLHVYLEVGSTETVIASVESGMGISIVSKWALNREPYRKVQGIKITDQGAVRNFYVIYPKQKSRRKTVNSFLDFIKKVDVIKGL